MKILWWLAIISTVSIAVLADSVGALWARGDNKLSAYFFLLCLLGPLVFISFGLVTTKIGLAIASGVVNSLLVFSTISVGLFIFGEWNKVTALQYVGMALALSGIVLMLFFPKAGS